MSTELGAGLTKDVVQQVLSRQLLRISRRAEWKMVECMQITAVMVRLEKSEVDSVEHADGLLEYGIPVDEPELDRMDLNHHKYTLLQEKLFFAPITTTPSKILDLGTGSGKKISGIDGLPFLTHSSRDLGDRHS